MGNEHILPDSRITSGKGRLMMDWPVPINGRKVRIEVEPTFCANCGKEGPYVPAENTSFSFYLCLKCAATHGKIDGVWMEPDDEFNRRVSEEMRAAFGKDLNPVEIAYAVDRDILPSSLKLLARESPYKVYEPPGGKTG